MHRRTVLFSQERRLRPVMLLLAALLASSPVQAILPPLMPDEALAAHPVIVVAHWSGTPLSPRNGPGDHTLGNWGSRTEIVVERVIKGNLRPGRYPILVGTAIGWNKEGGPVGWYTASEAFGEADVSKPNLWFLERQRGDGTDTTEYLYLDHFEGVQPLRLEPYFVALASAHPSREVPRLLTSGNAELIGKALYYICSDYVPYPPYPGTMQSFLTLKPPPENGSYSMSTAELQAGYRWRDRERVILYSQTRVVQGLLEDRSPAIRGPATAAYALLAGQKGLPRLRKMLQDPDPAVRATAITALAYYRDTGAVPGIAAATSGITDGLQAGSIITALDGWNDLRLAPALIRFLQTDSPEYYLSTGDEFQEDPLRPAIQAARVLKRLTGCLFPYDVRTSLSAWERAAPITDRQRRLRILRTLAPSDPMPVRAYLAKQNGQITVILQNRSARALWIERYPPIEYSLIQSDGGSMSSGDGGPDGVDRNRGPESFARLAPGASIVRKLNPITLQRLSDRPYIRWDMTLAFERSGSQLGLKAWMGRVKIEVPAAIAPGDPTAEQFRDAVLSGDLVSVERLVRGRPGLANRSLLDGYNASPPQTTYPLCIAAKKGWVSMTAFLLRAGAKVAIRDHDGRTPLDLAIAADSPQIVRQLLAAGANVETRNYYKQTPLMQVKSSVVARILLQAGARVNDRDDNGDTPLFRAANAGVTLALLEHGASAKAVNECGDTPLMGAGEEVTRLLLAHRADATRADANGDTALHEAAGQPHSDRIAALLINAGAKANAANADGDTPLHQAAIVGDAALAGALLARGVPINEKNRVGLTPLDLALLSKPDANALIALLRRAGGASPYLDAHGGAKTVAAEFAAKIKALQDRYGREDQNVAERLLESDRYIYAILRGAPAASDPGFAPHEPDPGAAAP